MTTNRARTLRGVLTSALVAAACVLTLPAYAATTPEPPAPPPATPDVVEDVDPAGDPHADTAEKFTSLTSALLSMYATTSGQTLESYLKTNQVMVTAAGNSDVSSPIGNKVGQLTTDPATPGATALDGATVGDVDTSLNRAGLSLDLRNYTSLQDMATDLLDKSHTADGAVSLAGAQWVSQLGSLRVPDLTAPTTQGATMPGIAREALPFGLLMNQSIAGTVLNAPDLFAEAARSGVGSEALSKVFSTQMLEAWESSSKSLTSALPNVCTGAMLAVMASGNPASATEYGPCNPACTTGGLYLNNQVSRVFAPADRQLSPNVTDQLWNYETLIQTQQWRTHDLFEQNPGLVQQLLAGDGTSGGALLCGAAATSTDQVLSQTLPGIFGHLRVQ